MRIVGPLLLGTCVKFTYAAQEGKGTHACSMEVRRIIKRDPINSRYFIKMDIHHYFDSIPRELLWKFIKRKIKCPDTLEILHVMIFTVPGRRGLAIGLYISQILSSFYLSSLDHWIIEVMGLKMLRYMDDIVVFASSKRILHRLRKLIEAKLKAEFGLKLKKNWRIAPITEGLDFVGFVHYPTHVMLRKSVKISYIRVANAVVRRLKKGILVDKHIMGALNSYDGMASWCDSNHLRERTMGRAMAAIEFGPEAVCCCAAA